MKTFFIKNDGHPKEVNRDAYIQSKRVSLLCMGYDWVTEDMVRAAVHNVQSGAMYNVKCPVHASVAVDLIYEN